jgi:glycosyltransferase involved in cell wall biosynthesis
MHYSVVIPTRNYAQYLLEALDSVLTQSTAPAQVIVVDDGSTDDTRQVLESHIGQKRIDYVYQPPASAAAARNHGLRQARHDLVAFLDSDDRWTPGKMDAQLAVLGERPDVMMVYGHIEQYISADAIDPDRWRLDAANTRLAGVCASTLLARKAVFDRVGSFDEGLRRAEFVDWHARVGSLGLAWVMLPDVLAYRRIHGANSSMRLRDDVNEYLAVARAALLRRRSKKPSAASIPGASGRE